MSYQAVQWALDQAPMLRTPAGKSDTTARAILVARAERADENGLDTHAGIEDIIWRTGFDATVIRRAERRLEAAGLLIPDGTTRWGTPRWNIDMSQQRSLTEREELEAEIARRKTSEAARAAANRAKQKKARTDAESVRTDSASVRTDSASVRTDAEPPEPPVNHPGTLQEPPTGGTLPPDPLRLPPPAASGTDYLRSLSEPLTPAQDQVGESLPRTRAKPPGLFPRAVPPPPAFDATGETQHRNAS